MRRHRVLSFLVHSHSWALQALQRAPPLTSHPVLSAQTPRRTSHYRSLLQNLFKKETMWLSSVWQTVTLHLPALISTLRYTHKHTHPMKSILKNTQNSFFIHAASHVKTQYVIFLKCSASCVCLWLKGEMVTVENANTFTIPNVSRNTTGEYKCSLVDEPSMEASEEVTVKCKSTNHDPFLQDIEITAIFCHCC